METLDIHFPYENLKWDKDPVGPDRTSVSVKADGFWNEYDDTGMVFCRKRFGESHAHGSYTYYVLRHDVERWLYQHKMRWWLWKHDNTYMDKTVHLVFDHARNAMLFKLTWG